MPAISIAADIFGTIEERTQLMDIVEAMGRHDIGPSHAGFLNEQGIYDLFLAQHRDFKPVRVYSPATSSEGALEHPSGLIGTCLAAGLTCRITVYSEVPAGYRYKNQDKSSKLLVVSPSSRHEFRLMGEEIAVTLKDVEEAFANDQVRALIDDVRSRSLAGNDLPVITLGPDVLEWLGEPATPAP